MGGIASGSYVEQKNCHDHLWVRKDSARSPQRNDGRTKISNFIRCLIMRLLRRFGLD